MTSHERTTYALIHGAGDVGWYWHLVAAELRRLGHEVIAPDLPYEDESVKWSDCADVVLDLVRDRARVIVVAHSLGGFVAPLVAARMPIELLVLVAAMIPRSGESANDYWLNTDYTHAGGGKTRTDPLELFYHDVPSDLAKEALARGRPQAKPIGAERWPLPAWPDVPVRCLICRHDRVFPAEWLRQVVRDRLGIEPDTIDGGHCPALGRPLELTERLERYRCALGDAARVTAGNPRPASL